MTELRDASAGVPDVDTLGVLPRFDRHLGIATRVESPGVCVAVLELAPEHRNIEGRIHGGVALTLLDTAMGHAVGSLGPAVVEGAATLQLSCQFLAAPAGLRMEARGMVTRLGGRSAFVDGTVRDERGTEIARAQGVWRVWRPATSPDRSVKSSRERDDEPGPG
ncbi:MAG: PaaI family thioesterase [Gemmatimonadota bacterium]